MTRVGYRILEHNKERNMHYCVGIVHDHEPSKAQVESFPSQFSAEERARCTREVIRFEHTTEDK